MFLYTVVPIEEVMKSEADEVKEVELIYLKAGSGCLAVEMMKDGSGKIVNLISSDPNDYMNPSWAPGNVVKGFQVGNGIWAFGHESIS